MLLVIINHAPKIFTVKIIFYFKTMVFFLSANFGVVHPETTSSFNRESGEGAKEGLYSQTSKSNGSEHGKSCSAIMGRTELL